MHCELNYAECERKERKQSYSGKKDTTTTEQNLNYLDNCSLQLDSTE